MHDGNASSYCYFRSYSSYYIVICVNQQLQHPFNALCKPHVTAKQLVRYAHTTHILTAASMVRS